ncbi:hypothetical protein FOA52_006129 [Chlamydomonas sp. UWO 241]|nr:hypothetical protein FOA52_006129 [Chlamydomonas sp. UWO 241]
MTQSGRLCATPFGIDFVGITESIALLGALVGGLSAAKRKDEVDKLNEQLRKINMQLRQQARAGAVYAPGLTYAPQSDSAIDAILRPPTEAEAPVSPLAAAAAAAAAAAPPPTPVVPPKPAKSAGPLVTVSVDEDDMTPDQLACRDALRAGKKMLRDANGAGALVRFEKALMLSRATGDNIQQRRAYRGLAAASRLQRQYETAIKHLHDVLDISRTMREYTGDADAYGTIADCYTDMGDFDKAASYYDKYISAMNAPDGVLV